MKFLLAGFGSIGRRHFRNLLALGERDIVVYRTGRSTLDTDELSGFPVETDFQKALDHRPDALIVANPTAKHLDVAIPAAVAGCHLLIEKPVSHSLDRIPELQAASQKSGSRTLVAFQFRFHPGLQKVKQLLTEGAIGQPLSVRGHWGEYLPAWHPWEDYRQGYSARADLGGGATLTLSHPLDYVRWLLGDVSNVWAFVGKTGGLEIEVDGNVEIGLHFASGTIGSLHLDYVQRPPAHWLEIVGSEGTLKWNNDSGEAQVFRAAEQRWETFPPREGFERNDLFLAEMQHFLDVIRGETESACSLEDGEQALRLALAALYSAQYGELVKLGA